MVEAKNEDAFTGSPYSLIAQFMPVARLKEQGQANSSLVYGHEHVMCNDQKHHSRPHRERRNQRNE